MLCAMVFLVGHNRYKSSHVGRTGFGENDKKDRDPTMLSNTGRLTAHAWSVTC